MPTFVFIEMFVPIRSYQTYVPAHIMLHRLEGEGIRAYLQDEHTVTIDPVLGSAIGGVKLMVFAEQAERALELAEQFEKEYRESGPVRNAGRTIFIISRKQKNVTNWATALLTWLFGSYAISVHKVFHCYGCGFEFKDEGE